MSYKDLIIEGFPVGEDVHSPPQLPEDYNAEYISTIPRIPVPNGRFVFYIRAKDDVIERLASDPRVKSQVIARSWPDLFFGNYPYWDHVFDFDVTEIIEGQECRVRRKLADITDQEINGVYVPGVFAGDKVPELPLPRFVITGFQRFRQDTQLVIPIVTEINDALIKRIRANPNELDRLEPRQFEKLVFEILTQFGWELERTRATKDGGYDIFGFSGSPGGGQKRLDYRMQKVQKTTKSWGRDCKGSMWC